MGGLFIVALLLAWPTFGLSIVAWAVLAFFNAKKNAYKNNQRRVISEIISPMFDRRYGVFYCSLDVPYEPSADDPRFFFDYDPSPEDAPAQCGRHIVNYICHNPGEAALFMEGLKFWSIKGRGALCDPVEAAECERMQKEKRNIHLVSYRAIEALMMHNNLPCFKGVDLPLLKQYIDAIEARMAV